MTTLLLALALAAPPARGTTVPDTAAVVPDTQLVAAHDLPRGVALAAGDIDTVVTLGPQALDARRSSLDARPGWITHRVVRAGEPLRPPTVTPPPLLTRGARVTVVWETDGLRVTREGVALGAADSGEVVTVRVDATRRVTGRATAPGVVTVGTP
ncbi:MAG TPA: flagellar basal body P-ring formation chaperone FlgA [Gemmatimonadaceae bacterium]|nr:flagellar basal body P-ring formation chaperone FlgA [Gemmatimonadaceae bacterium]